MMRDIKKIIVHCSDTRPSMDIGVEEIRKWHVEENKWSDIGYHFVIRRDGTVESGRSVERPGAHVKGENSDSIGICWVGGMAEDAKVAQDNRTGDQTKALFDLIQELQQEFEGAAVLGHRDIKGVKKQCPCFDVREWYTQSCRERKPKRKTVRLSTIFRSVLPIIWKLWRYHRSTQRR